MDSITITKNDLQNLIAKEVAKAITNKPQVRIAPNTMLDGVRLSGKELIDLNNKHKQSKDNNSVHSEWYTSTFSRSQRLEKRWNDKYELSNQGPNSTDINTQIRKLTLSVLGETKLSDLKSCDYEKTISLYIEFKQFFLDKYEERLNELFGDE